MKILLAPQSGALIKGDYRDFHSHPIPIHPLIAVEHLILYIQNHVGAVTAKSISIYISKSETINDPLTDPLTDRGNCKEMLLHLKKFQ